MKISFDTKSKNITYPSFKGLTKKLAHKIYIDGKLDIAKMIEKSQPKNTNVGKLPPIFFNAIKPEERKEKIKQIWKLFCEVADEIRDFRSFLSDNRDEQINRRPQSVVDKLKKIFIDLNLIKKEDSFDLHFLGEGNYKKAYRFDGIQDPKTGERICIKVFHVVDNSPEWHKYKTHGNYAELNISNYWRKTKGVRTQRGKFYFGDIQHGFFVDKYIDETVNKPKKIIDESYIGLKLTDEVKDNIGHNRLYGYSIDPGGPRVVNRIKNESRIARRIFNHIKNTPKKYREQEWYKILANRKVNKQHKQAGLAIAIKHLNKRSAAFDTCLDFNDVFTDIGLAYVLKYQKEHNALKYFKILLQRNNPTTQTVLLNEIPLIARKKVKQDDLNVPKGEINSIKLLQYYKIAQENVLPEVEEHLASLIHLLPDEYVIAEAKKLISKNNYQINDRLLHKIKFTKDEEFSFNKKMEILNLLEKTIEDEYLKNKLKEVKIYIIRSQLED